MDMSVLQRIGNNFTLAACEWFASAGGIAGSGFIPGMSSSMGGSSMLFAMNPEVAAGMFALQFAAPLLQQFLSALPNFGRMEQNAGTPEESSSIHGNRHKRNQEAPNTQAEIDRILASSLPLEEKIILIAGLVSQSVGSQLEDLLQQQGQMAKNMDKAAGGSSAGAQFQNMENRIQLLVQRLNRMQTLSSNLLQALHTTQRTVLSNIRV